MVTYKTLLFDYTKLDKLELLKTLRWAINYGGFPYIFVRTIFYPLWSETKIKYELDAQIERCL